MEQPQNLVGSTSQTIPQTIPTTQPSRTLDEDGDVENLSDPEPEDEEVDDKMNGDDSDIYEEEEDRLEIKEGTTLYIISKDRTFDEDKAPDVIKFYTTVAQCERDVLEQWKDYFMLTYEVQESFYAISVDEIDEDTWLYGELDIPERAEEPLQIVMRITGPDWIVEVELYNNTQSVQA